MSDKPKTLEDLVPPLELCKAAREVIGDRTAMVWEVYHYQYSVDPYVMSRETSETTRGSAVESVYPAPTLAELLEMLPETVGNGEVLIFEYGKIKGQKEAIVHYPGMREYCGHDVNPATAALRLLMKVKGVAV